MRFYDRRAAPGRGRLFSIRRATTPMAERADTRLCQIIEGD
jgi:hypothetical protein